MLARQPAALPHGIVAVLDRQAWQWVLQAPAQGWIQHAELVGQHPQGPAVGNGMVHGQGQYMVLLAQAQQAGAQQWPGDQVEGRDSLAAQACGQVLRRQCLAAQPARLRGRIDPHFGAVATRHEAAAQGFVALDDTQQGALQRRGVQRAPQPQGQRHVVSLVAAFQLGQEPQALLGERQRQGLFAVNRHDHR